MNFQDGSPYTPIISRMQKAANSLSEHELQELCGPFIISAPKEFQNSSSKILFVGQETYGWVPFKQMIESGETFINQSKKWYAGFDFAEGHKASRSPFWKFHRQLCKELNLHYRSILWSNLVRFDRKNQLSKRASIIHEPYAPLILNCQIGMLRNEIEENDINRIVFLTGPNYDYIIKNEFGHCDFSEIHKSYSKRQVCSIHTEDYPKIQMIRTYHPAYLQRSKKFEPILKICADFIKL